MASFHTACCRKIEVGGKSVQGINIVGRSIHTSNILIFIIPFLNAHTCHTREVMSTPITCVSKVVLIHPVPVQVIVRVTVVALLPLICNQTWNQFLTLVEIEVGIDVGAERQMLVELKVEILIEVSFIRIGKVGSVINQSHRVLLTIKHTYYRAVRIGRVEVRTTAEHRTEQLTLVHTFLLGIRQRHAATHAQPLAGRIVCIDAGAETLIACIIDNTTLIIVCGIDKILQRLRTTTYTYVNLVLVTHLGDHIEIVVIYIEEVVVWILQDVHTLIWITTTISKEVISACLIIKQAVCSVSLRDLVRELTPRVIILYVDLRFAFLTTTCSHDDHTIGRTRAIDSCRGSILEHFHRNNITWVDVIYALHRSTVYNIKR